MKMHTTGASSHEQILREADVLARTRLSASTIRRLRRSGEFPQPRRIARHAVGWLASEINEWLAALPEVSELRNRGLSYVSSESRPSAERA